MMLAVRLAISSTMAPSRMLPCEDSRLAEGKFNEAQSQVGQQYYRNAGENLAPNLLNWAISLVRSHRSVFQTGGNQGGFKVA